MLLIIFGRFKSLITKSIQCEKLLHFLVATPILCNSSWVRF